MQDNRDSRDISSSPILTTGPHSSRFSFSPCSRPVSPPILSPICSHDEESSIDMDEATRQSWSGTYTDPPSSYPERTVLMETYDNDNEAGYFRYVIFLSFTLLIRSNNLEIF